ncbi:MAG: hypothetical protein AAGD01_19580 [Acidobacteriota bacterium]
MGTFHDHKGEYHGITVVVETRGGELLVGRCDTVTDDAVVMLKLDRYSDKGTVLGREEWLQRAAMVGIFPSIDRLVIPRREVASLRRLGEIEG